MNRNKGSKHKINLYIRAEKVRLVSAEAPYNQVINIQEALEKAKLEGLDLVQISESHDTPVCKIMDYKKFLYDNEKNKKKPTKTIIKEIQFKFNTDENDFQRKVKDAEKFLKKGFKVRTNVLIFGRNWEFKKDQAELMTLKLVTSLEEFGSAEYTPKMTNKKMHCIIKPKKNGNS